MSGSITAMLFRFPLECRATARSVSGNIRRVARLARPKSSPPPIKRPKTGQPPPVEELMCELMGLSKGIRRFMEQRFAEHNLPAALSGPRMGVLFQVQKSGGLRMGDLAERLGVAPRTVTDLVDGLERDGLLLRRPDPADRRATLLDLTPRAQVDFDRAHATSKVFLQEIFSPLQPAERRQFMRLLAKLRKGPIAQTTSGYATSSDPCRD